MRPCALLVCAAVLSGCGAAGVDVESGVDEAAHGASNGPIESVGEESVDMATVSIDAEVGTGLYHIDLDSPLRVTFAIPADGWRGWAGAFKADTEGRLVAFTVGLPTQVSVDPCGGARWIDPGPSVVDFADALAALPGMLVQQEPEAADVSGFPAVHLTLEVPEVTHSSAAGFDGFVDCVDSRFYGWRGPTGRPEGVLERRYPAPRAVVDYWVVEAGASRVLIETIRFRDSDGADTAVLDRILSSVRIAP